MYSFNPHGTSSFINHIVYIVKSTWRDWVISPKSHHGIPEPFCLWTFSLLYILHNYVELYSQYCCGSKLFWQSGESYKTSPWKMAHKSKILCSWTPWKLTINSLQVPPVVTELILNICTLQIYMMQETKVPYYLNYRY